jgi:phosphoribosyl-ATP pyrophosphohydrolase
MLHELFSIIQERRLYPGEGSYTAHLFADGEDAILKKVGEEATEVILAAKGQGNQRLVEEVADLFYHTLVLLSSRGLSLDDIESELRRRHTERQTPPVDLSADSSPGPG